MSGAEQPRASEVYLRRLQEVLAEAAQSEVESVRQAAGMVADAFDDDGFLYVFGSGHSHVLAEEGFYRAGGSARIAPILQDDYMLHVSAQRSTELEREPGHAGKILELYPIQPGRDVMLVVSNSGSNALPIEMAMAARRRDLGVIAVTSRAYAGATGASGPRLHDLADVVLDNHCPPGDAMITIAPGLPSAGPGSNAVGIALLNAVIVEALALQAERGAEPDIYLSAGMPGGIEHNRRLADRFRSRIRHL